MTARLRSRTRLRTNLASVYDHIDLKLTDFAPGKKFGLDIAAHLPGQGKQLLSFKGKVGPLDSANSAATPVDGHISLEEVSLAAANRFAAGTLPPQTDGIASGDADINSQAAQLSAKGNLKLQNIVLKGSKLDFPITADYDLSADRRSEYDSSSFRKNRAGIDFAQHQRKPGRTRQTC